MTRNNNKQVFEKATNCHFKFLLEMPKWQLELISAHNICIFVFVNIWGIFQLVCIPIGSSQGNKEHVDLMAFDDYRAKLCYKWEKFKLSLMPVFMCARCIIIIIINNNFIIIARSYIAHYHCSSFHVLRPLLSLPSGNHQNYFASSRRQPANVHNLSDLKLWHPP